MEKSSGRVFEEFGGRVASAWRDLRPTTRTLVERALQSASAPGGAGGAHYDARSEMELSRLLEVLDERAREADTKVLSAEQSCELVRVANACAFLLHNEARSAEVFAQLLERALSVRDYARVDKIADTLSSRLAPTEICELARNQNPALRAIAHEALAQKPSSVLVELLGDPVDAEVAREALELQADDYDSEEARWIVSTLERIDEDSADD
jgi:ribosomal protein L16 Arg81 hydroxylase